MKNGDSEQFLTHETAFTVPVFRRRQKFSRTDALKKRLCAPLSWIEPNGVDPLMLRKGVDGVG
jgi:hypothetical protein